MSDSYHVRAAEIPDTVRAEILPGDECPVRLLLPLRDLPGLARNPEAPRPATSLAIHMSVEVAREVYWQMHAVAQSAGWPPTREDEYRDGMQRIVTTGPNPPAKKLP